MEYEPHTRLGNTMYRGLISIAATAYAVLFLCSRVSAVIVLGNIDNFQSGTNEGWVHQKANVNFPTNVMNVGPTGGGDHSLLISSSGVFGSGSRFLAFNNINLGNWTGDYTTAGVNAIQAEFNNIGATNLNMRLALNGPGGWFTTAPFAVNAGGGWQPPISFPVTPAGLTHVAGGTNNINSTLSNVTQIQLFSAAGFPTTGMSGRPLGDLILGSAYVDNIIAIPEASSFLLLGVLCIGIVLRFVVPRTWRRRNAGSR